MSKCSNCGGEGLVGQGDQPWLRQGRIVTCSGCGGSGQLADEAGAEQAPEAVPAEPVNADESSSVDNAEGEPKGFVASIVDAITG